MEYIVFNTLRAWVFICVLPFPMFLRVKSVMARDVLSLCYVFNTHLLAVYWCRFHFFICSLSVMFNSFDWKLTSLYFSAFSSFACWIYIFDSSFRGWLNWLFSSIVSSIIVVFFIFVWLNEYFGWSYLLSMFPLFFYWLINVVGVSLISSPSVG